MIIKRIVIGVIGIVGGLILIKFREQLQRLTGPIGFAEKYLGQGGTFSFLAMLGGASVILSILYMTGVLQTTLGRLLGPYF